MCTVSLSCRTSLLVSSGHCTPYGQELTIFGTLITPCPLLTLGFLQTSLTPCAYAGTVTIISGEGQMALNGCSFCVATGRVGEKTNKNNKKKANEKVADKVTEKVEVMQLG
ncbi:hypothetical protein NOF04DRAFT_11681 [Fusarium oxysporum II5]|uniref:Uncharacterized protein n=2 Tax=Fusarium oxysporum species complex TaxID=171631 RepID=X0KBJ1_FUSO5|nr:uncharacterized protein FOIG_12883 [Fusarium odoratissimum NRRL 54006]EXL94324.1 hypothetical protein FOIG_12883 [Fusarium odoratissimum NRRL 54006]KAK2135128.1 hypothetical protein NOF04DRAFT_11681 [Fusarium oxysporum II5]TXC12182.1 hypothetical protein FocTR4_00006977 [Fusarium oxysporum f. sp. cubense]